MRILIIPFLLAVSLPAFAEVDPKIHKLCIDAKDYLGCTQAMNGETSVIELDEVGKQLQAAKKMWREAGSKKSLIDKNRIEMISDIKAVLWIDRNSSKADWAYSNMALLKNSLTKKDLDLFTEQEIKHYSNDKATELIPVCQNRIKKIKEFVPEAKIFMSNHDSICHIVGQNAKVSNSNLINALREASQDDIFTKICKTTGKSLHTIYTKNGFMNYCATSKSIATEMAKRDVGLATQQNQQPTFTSYRSNTCQPGKSLYQKKWLFGLIKGGTMCLTDFEAESLKAQGRQSLQNSLNNLGNSLKSNNKPISCYGTANTIGSTTYAQTNCY